MRHAFAAAVGCCRRVIVKDSILYHLLASLLCVVQFVQELFKGAKECYDVFHLCIISRSAVLDGSPF